MTPIRNIVLVEDDSLLRSLLASQLRLWGFGVHTAGSAAEATKLCLDVDPDGVVLDVDLGTGANGFQLAEALGRQLPHLAIVFLTRFPDARSSISRMSPALRGASYVNKNAIDESDELLEAINAALNDAGRTVKGPALSTQPLAGLTRRQLDVLRMMHDGKTNAQITRERGTTLSATENLITRIFRELEIDRNVANPRAIAVRKYAEAYGYTSR